MIDSHISEDLLIPILKFLSTRNILSAGEIKVGVCKAIVPLKADQMVLYRREAEPKIHTTIQNALRPNQELRRKGWVEYIARDQYRITAEGRTHLADYHAMFARMMEALNAMFPDEFD